MSTLDDDRTAVTFPSSSPPLLSSRLHPHQLIQLQQLGVAAVERQQTLISSSQIYSRAETRQRVVAENSLSGDSRTDSSTPRVGQVSPATVDASRTPTPLSVGRLTMSAKPPEPAAMYHGSTAGSGPGGGPGAGGGLLHAFPSRPLTTDAIYNPSAIYAAAAAAQAYIPFGASDSSAFYPALNSEGVAAVEAWRNFSAAQTAAAAAAAWAYDPALVSYPYGASYGALDVRRKNATRESTSTLKAWLYEHIKNPYPTKGEKIMLAIITKMTLTQVSTWFANARRRLKKENKMQWSPRNRTDNDDDDDDDEDKNSDDDDVDARRSRTNVDDCDEIDVGGVDDDVDDDNRDRDFLRGRSPFSHYSVDVGSRDTFWDGQSRPEELPRGALSNPDVSPIAKSFSATRDSRQSPLPAPQRPEKPRIWSLADVATSTTTPSSGRRSPSQAVDVAVARPPPLPIGAPSLSLPPLPAGFQPWTNGISGHHRHGFLPPRPSASSSPPVTHRPLPPVANGLLRYAPYPVVVGGGHPTSHAAVSHQLAAAAAAHAAAVNAAVQARLQTPISGPGDISTPSAAVGRSSSPPPSHWPSIERHAVKTASSIIICTDSENSEICKRAAVSESSRNSSPATASPSASVCGTSQTAFKPVTPRRKLAAMYWIPTKNVASLAAAADVRSASPSQDHSGVNAAQTLYSIGF